MTHKPPKNDVEFEYVQSEITSHIKRTVSDAEADGVVVAMSGGLDSTLTAALAVEALNPDSVLGVGLPCGKMEALDVNEASTIADGLGIEFSRIQLRPLLDIFEDFAAPGLEPPEGDDGDWKDLRVSVGNLISRFRMVCMYYAANRRSRLVLGTANRSELLLGYFTKYGDGAADLYPIGDLYKTEVGGLADHLGLPKRIVSKEPTARFWVDQTDESELGASYERIDPILKLLIDQNHHPKIVADVLDVEPTLVNQIVEMYLETLHKRKVPPTPEILPRDLS